MTQRNLIAGVLTSALVFGAASANAIASVVFTSAVN